MVWGKWCFIAHYIQEEIYDRCRKMWYKCDSGKWSEDEARAERRSKNEDVRRVNGEAYQIPIRTSSSQETLNLLEARIKGSQYGGYSRKIAIKKNSVNMILDAIKVENGSMMFYIAAKRYDPEGQEANTNMP